MRFLPHRSSDAARSSPPDASPTGARPSDDALRHVCVDLLLERYAGWREECQTLDTAYRQWAVSSGSEREQAFAAYRAALDREEQAASAYGCVAARLVDPEAAEADRDADRPPAPTATRRPDRQV